MDQRLRAVIDTAEAVVEAPTPSAIRALRDALQREPISKFFRSDQRSETLPLEYHPPLRLSQFLEPPA